MVRSTVAYTVAAAAKFVTVPATGASRSSAQSWGARTRIPLDVSAVARSCRCRYLQCMPRCNLNSGRTREFLA
jgi:hypothetical protein